MRAPGGPRLLLRRLREVMAEPVTAQARLDRIVVLIASNMVAEVCSLYVVRADGAMELFATEGLNREAVHLTTMKPGEGLVGLIASSAEPLALSDAQHHPAFSYKPETGEEIYQSFLGVPVLRGGATIGVLVVQNRARRTYSEEEVEALQTTAMLLAEMIASGELQGIAAQGAPIAVRRPMSLKGQGIADGLGLGHVVMHQPRVAVSKIVADDVDSELQRLETAISAMRASVDDLIDRNDDGQSGEHRDVLEAFRMIAHDRGWLRRLREAVSSGLTAEAAVERVQNDARAKLQRQTDPYLRDRLHDLTDIANRLLHQLAGQSLVLLPEELPESAILVARSMSPAALLDYDRARLRGIVLEEAGASSHIAIVARALALPAVSEIPNISEIVEHGDAIIVDGDAGEIHLRPPPDVEAAYAEKARMRARKQAQYRALRDVPTVSLDGVPIGLHMNAGLLVDMPHLAETGREVDRPLPDRTAVHARLALPEAGRAGKSLSRHSRSGWRSSRDVPHPRHRRRQAAALYEGPRRGESGARLARASHRTRPPGPLAHAVSRLHSRRGGRAICASWRRWCPTVEEFKTARALFDRELAWNAAHGYEPPRSVKLGVMVEVPSLLWQIDEIAACADFLSVGSNDLMQYLYAVDRDNRRVANRFDPLSVGFLRALRSIAEAGARAGTPVTLCGEIGGRPLEAMALMAVGYRDLSMSATSIGPVKAMTLSLKIHDVAPRGRGDVGGGPRRGLAARAAAGAGRALQRAPLAAQSASRRFHSSP